MKGHFAALIGGVAAAGAVAYGIGRARAKSAVQGGALRNQPRTSRQRPMQQRAAEPTGQIDLNTATVDEFVATQGVDRESAERIIENRPYRNKLDLVSRMVLPQDAYDAIKNSVFVDGSDEAIKIA